MFPGQIQDTQFSDTDLIEFHTPGGEWAGPAGWGLAALASLAFMIVAAPSSLGLLLGLAALASSVDAGYAAWHVGGRVLVGEGLVRVCPMRESRPQVTKLEAPYTAFHKVLVSRRRAGEIVKPLVTVDLLHDIPNRPAIGLYAEPGAYLPYEDRSLINRLAARLNIPIDETH